MWADDLALAYRCEEATDITSSMQEITSQVFSACLKHGLIPNLKAGKTELLVAPKGSGSRQVRIDLFNGKEPKLQIPNVPDNFREVRLISQYRHLGTRIHVGTKLMAEVKSRMGQAWTAYKKMRRQIFHNRLLSLQKRVGLFRSMIMPIFEYNLGTWGPLQAGEFKYFSKRLNSFYRSLVRADVHECELRLWNQDRVRAYLQLPSPGELLHGARLRYALSLYRSPPDTLWTLVGCERKWYMQLVEAQDWFYQQLRGYGPDRSGHQWKPNLHDWRLQNGRSMSSWIRKAEEVAQLNHKKWVDWREWHFEMLQEMIEGGLQMRMPWPDVPQQKGNKQEACLRCKKAFPNKAAWSVHAFKVHNRLNKARALVRGSRCDACEKEYYTSTKLQTHLCNSRRCYDKLLLAGRVYNDVVPGKNNTREQKAPDLMVPPQRSEGPRASDLDHELRVEANNYDEELAESITDALLALPTSTSIEGCVEAIRTAVADSVICFGDVRKTIFYMKDNYDKEEMDPGWNIHHGRLGVAFELAARRLRLDWFFDKEELMEDPEDQEIRDSAAQYATTGRSAVGWHFPEHYWTGPPEIPLILTCFPAFVQW